MMTDKEFVKWYCETPVSQITSGEDQKELDAELSRRHPYQKIEPVRSAEPALVNTEREQLHAAPDRKLTEPAAWVRERENRNG